MNESDLGAAPSLASESASVSSGPPTSDEITASVLDALEAAEPTDAAADASSATAPDAAAPSRETGTIDPPAAPVVDEAVPSQGPIPFDRHERAIQNAREQARSEAEQTFRQRYSVADLKPHQVGEAAKLYQWLNQNPQGFHEFLSQQLTAAQKPADTPPEPDLKAEDGTPVFSAPQMQKLLEWQQRQIAAKVEQEYGPVRKQVLEERLQRQAATQATGIVTEARTNWPLFAELEGDIKQRMGANQTLDLNTAYMMSFREKGQSLLYERFRKDHEGTLAHKSAAATTRPGVQPTTPRDYKNMSSEELTAEIFSQFEANGR